MAVGAVVLWPRMCRHYPLRQSHWSDYYPVFNRFKLSLLKANSKFQRADQASQTFIFNKSISFAYKLSISIEDLN
jgi:hypothetical protein